MDGRIQESTQIVSLLLRLIGQSNIVARKEILLFTLLSSTMCFVTSFDLM